MPPAPNFGVSINLFQRDIWIFFFSIFVGGWAWMETRGPEAGEAETVSNKEAQEAAD